MRTASTLSRLAFAVAAVATFVACAGGEPRPIAYDQATCAYCHMGITDRRFGAELVTDKGKVHEFDSIECLASYYLKNRESARSMWVTDFARPGTLVRADTARYVRSGGLQSPMGLGIVAFGSLTGAEEPLAKGGEALRWTDVLALVERTGGDPHAAAPGPHGERDARP